MNNQQGGRMGYWSHHLQLEEIALHDGERVEFRSEGIDRLTCLLVTEVRFLFNQDEKPGAAGVVLRHCVLR
jgi:hypothetical protein